MPSLTSLGSNTCMPDSPVQFHETELGNRYLIREGIDIEQARSLAQKVLDTSAYPDRSIGGLRHKLNCFLLDKAVIVTMGDYEDDEVIFTPASGEQLASLVLTGTETQ